jgi:hypothetical protein
VPSATLAAFTAHIVAVTGLREHPLFPANGLDAAGQPPQTAGPRSAVQQPDVDLARQREVVDAFLAAAGDGAAGAVITLHGGPFAVMDFAVVDGRIVEIDAIAVPARVQRLAGSGGTR